MQLKQSLDDRRNAVRLTYRVHVTVTLEVDGTECEGWSSNVSVAGMALDFEIPEQFHEQECRVRILFPGQHSDLVIEKLQGKVIRSDKKSAAISFIRPLEWFLLFPVYQNKLANPSKAPTGD